MAPVHWAIGPIDCGTILQEERPAAARHTYYHSHLTLVSRDLTVFVELRLHSGTPRDNAHVNLKLDITNLSSDFVRAKTRRV